MKLKRGALALIFFVMLGTGQVMAQTSTPTPMAPLPLDDLSQVVQDLTDDEFPRLGNPEAPVQIVEFCSFDAPGCASFHRDELPNILPRLVTGEVSYTFVPIKPLGVVPNAREAGRGALCAADQGYFWQLSTAYFTMLLTPEGAAGYEVSRLTEPFASIPVNRERWNACMQGIDVDILFDGGELVAARQEDIAPDQLPFIVVNGARSLADAASINAVIDFELERLAEVTPDPNATEEPLVVNVQPLQGSGYEPPFEIILPVGWTRAYNVLQMLDTDQAVRLVPLAIYSGPITGGQGTIALLWGFPNFTSGNPFEPGGGTPDLWADGLRLLRLAVIEPGCTIGTDMRTSYTIGGLPAVGTQFSAVNCGELPDTRGWFAGIEQHGLNFIFFQYAEPIDAMTTGQAELQAILDSIVFQIAAQTPTPAP